MIIGDDGEWIEDAWYFKSKFKKYFHTLLLDTPIQGQSGLKMLKQIVGTLLDTPIQGQKKVYTKHGQRLKC